MIGDWETLRDKVVDIAARRLSQMYYQDETVCRSLVAELISGIDTGIRLHDPNFGEDGRRLRIEAIDTVRYIIRDFSVSDPESMACLEFMSELKSLMRDVDHLYVHDIDDRLAISQFEVRIGPTNSTKSTMSGLLAWKETSLRAEEELVATIPDGSDLNPSIVRTLREKVTLSLRVLRIAIRRDMAVPFGIVRRVGRKAIETWGNIKDMIRASSPADRVDHDNLERLETEFIELSRAITNQERMNVAFTNRHKPHLDREIRELVLKGLRPSIEHALGAQELDLSNGKLTSLELISDCKNITKLNVDANPELADLQVLSEFSALNFIRASDTMIPDVGFVRDLLQLETLDIKGTRVSDLKPALNLTMMRDLNIRATRVTDLAFLGYFNQIESLNLSLLSKVTGTELLPGLAKLTDLDVRDVDWVDEELLSELTGLRKLFAINTPIRTLSWVKNLKRLSVLAVAECRIEDWGSLLQTSVETIVVSSRQAPSAADALRGSAIKMRITADQ